MARRRLYGLVAAVALFLLALASALFSLSEWRSANAAFEAYKAEEQKRKTEDKMRHAAEAAREQLALEKSQADALEAADRERAEALIAAASRKDYDGAVGGLTDALFTYEHYRNLPGMVRARVERGNIYALSDRKDLAEKDIEHAVALAKQTGTPGLEAIALEAKAALHEQSGAPDTAALYKQAEDRYRPAGDLHSVARIRSGEPRRRNAKSNSFPRSRPIARLWRDIVSWATRSGGPDRRSAPPNGHMGISCRFKERRGASVARRPRAYRTQFAGS